MLTRIHRGYENAIPLTPTRPSRYNNFLCATPVRTVSDEAGVNILCASAVCRSVVKNAPGVNVPNPTILSDCMLKHSIDLR